MSITSPIKFPRFVVLHASHPTSLEIDEIARQWDFHPADLQEFSGRAKRTRLEIYPEYLCLVTLWPTYRRSAKDIQSAELSFFLRTDALIIVQRGVLPIFSDLLRHLAASGELRNTYAQRTPERLLYDILRKLYQSVFPMIDHLIDDCDRIEQEIFSSRERQMVPHILAIRRNITGVRKILQVHKNVMRRLTNHLTDSPQFALQSSDRYFGELVDCAREDWDTLENLKERIEALQQTNESQISFRMADIMKTLTIISVFTFPLTLVAALFSIRQTKGMPFLDQPNNFWYVLGIEALVAAIMFLVFKRKRWF